MKITRLSLAILLAQLLPLAVHAESCSAFYTATFSAVTVRNLTRKTLWVNMGDAPSKGEQGLVYGYKVITPNQAVCFARGIRGAGMWVREPYHNDALYFPLGYRGVADEIRGISTLEILPEAGTVSQGFKHPVMNSGGSEPISRKIVQLVRGNVVMWIDYAKLIGKNSILIRRGKLIHYEKP